MASNKKYRYMVLFWFSMAMLFCLLIYTQMGKEKALEFLTGYAIEMSLSIDNLFVFILIFTAFKIPKIYQSRILFYGLLGAVTFRFIFIYLGVSFVERFQGILYFFGAILIISGIKMIRAKHEHSDPANGKIIKVIKKFVPVTETIESEKFFVRLDGVLHATPLFVALVLIELSDIMFAIDSIPAIFSVTTDILIVYTSNIFAILGLRSLYFVLEEVHEKFVYVKYGVAIILMFTGTKLLLLFFGIHIPTTLSLFIIVSILASSIIASIVITNKQNKLKP